MEYINFSENKFNSIKSMLTILPSVDNFQVCLKNEGKMNKEQKIAFVRMIDSGKLIH